MSLTFSLGTLFLNGVQTKSHPHPYPIKCWCPLIDRDIEP